jgi:hypothetical protein
VSRLVRAPQVISQHAGSTLVLLDVHDGRYFSLEGVGPMIWDLCDGSRTPSDLASTLGGAFAAVPPEVVRADVDALLAELRRERLVTDAA